ncbi:MAG: ABC transporter permease subunit [Proteobacteria bacterium]|nr:ABC transporter permease subunit [Pseudomonadota bacterium]
MKFWAVLKRELREQVRNRKLFFVMLFILFGAFMALYTDVPLTEDSNNLLEAIFDSFHKFCALMGVMVAMDAVVGEKERGTLELVLSKPLSRATLLLGKFVSYVMAVVPLLLIELILVYYWAKVVGVARWQSPLPPMSQWLAMIAIVSLVCTFHIVFTIIVSLYARSTVSCALISMISIMPGSPAGTGIIEWLGWTDFGKLVLPFRAMSLLTSDYQRYALLYSASDYWICVSLLLLLVVVLLLVAGWLFEKQDISFK